MTTPAPGTPVRPAGLQKLGPGVLTIGEAGSLVDASSLVNGCTMTPNTETADATTKLSGYVRGGSSRSTYALEGNVDTDAANADGLWELCFQLAGEEVPFVFVPESATGVTVEGTLILRPLALGGDEVESDLTSDFSFPIVGRPDVSRAGG